MLRRLSLIICFASVLFDPVNCLAQRIISIKATVGGKEQSILIDSFRYRNDYDGFRFSIRDISWYVLTDEGLSGNSDEIIDSSHEPTFIRRLDTLPDYPKIQKWPDIEAPPEHYANYQFRRPFFSIMSEDMLARQITFKGVNCDIFSRDDTLGQFIASNSRFRKFWIKFDKFNELIFEKDTLPMFLNDEGSKIGTLSFKDCVLGTFLADARQIDTIIFNNITLDSSNSTFDITSLSTYDGNRTVLMADIESLRKLKFNYFSYDLIPMIKSNFSGNNQTQQSTTRLIYTTLIELQKQYGFGEGEQKATKELLAFEYTKDKTFSGYLINFFERRWWGLWIS